MGLKVMESKIVDWIYLARNERVAASSQQSNKTSGSVKSRKYPNQPRDY